VTTATSPAVSSAGAHAATTATATTASAACHARGPVRRGTATASLAQAVLGHAAGAQRGELDGPDGVPLTGPLGDDVEPLPGEGVVAEADDVDDHLSGVALDGPVHDHRLDRRRVVGGPLPGDEQAGLL